MMGLKTESQNLEQRAPMHAEVGSPDFLFRQFFLYLEDSNSRRLVHSGIGSQGQSSFREVQRLTLAFSGLSRADSVLGPWQPLLLCKMLPRSR